MRGTLTSLILVLMLTTNPRAGEVKEPRAPIEETTVEETTVDEAARDEAPLTDADWDHWAFRPLDRRAPPPVQNADWVRNPIDHFILARIEAEGLRPLPSADRATLIRRLSFGLTGLPPTLDAIDAFLHDAAPNAYERLIDRLLASPHYGERWGQHWLDLARFAQTDGYEHDHTRPTAWRYRDWVINALNADLPYDQFVRLQIAADEIAPSDLTALVATGFALSGPDMPDINDQNERRHMLLNDIASTVGEVFLGLNIGCAQCHDHKFDPISQADFYRLRAFFENAQIFDHDHPLAPAEEIARWKKARADYSADVKKVTARIEELENLALEKIAAKRGTKLSKAERKELKLKGRELRAALSAAEARRYDAVQSRLRKIGASEPARLPHGRLLREKRAAVKPSHVMVRGNFKRPGPRVKPGYPRIANRWEEMVRPASKEAASSGLRSQLAHWLTRPDHPLATRVIVNRLWQHHFGVGIAATPSLFGSMGETPTHPELLDWLASELPRLDWSLKRLHKLILMSATYRQASRAASPEWNTAEKDAATESLRHAVAVDPENHLLARARRRRLDGEEIRDALLVASGRLNTRRGGAGFIPPLPGEVRKSVKPNCWQVTPDPSEHRRRSIYVFVRRNLRYPFFEVFDSPDSNFSCARRDRTTIAPQSLALLNSELSMDAARHLAGRVVAESDGDQDAWITRAYRLTLARGPEPAEIELAQEFLAQVQAELQASDRPRDELSLPQPFPNTGVDPRSGAALTAFCLSLFNLNEFVYVD